MCKGEQMKKYFRLLPFPGGEDKLTQFLNTDSLSVGWAELNDVSNLDREEIKARYMKTYPGSNIHASRLVASYFIKLKELMPGDIILVPHSDQYHFFEVVGGYFYDGEEQDVYMRQRIKVSFITTLEKNDFSAKMRKSIGVQPTITWIQQYKDEIDRALYGKAPMVLLKQKSVVYMESKGSITLNYNDSVSKKTLQEFFTKVLEEI